METKWRINIALTCYQYQKLNKNINGYLASIKLCTYSEEVIKNSLGFAKKVCRDNGMINYHLDGNIQQRKC